MRSGCDIGPQAASLSVMRNESDSHLRLADLVLAAFEGAARVTNDAQRGSKIAAICVSQVLAARENRRIARQLYYALAV